jgi:ribokinase
MSLKLQQRGRIVCVGAHIQGLLMRVDRIPGPGESVLGSHYSEPLDGGKASNYAMAASRLGASVVLVTVVGNDNRAARWLRFFAEEGIETEGVLAHDGPTDVGIVLLPPDGIPALASVPSLTMRHLTADSVRANARLFEGASAVLCALECRVEAVREAFQIGRASGALTILNSSPAEAMEESLFELVDLLVLNEHEAALLAGTTGGPEHLAATLSQRSGVHVIVTAGFLGAFSANPGGSLAHYPAASVRVANTTGAGDAFLGALAAELQAGADLDTATRFAVAAATVSVTRDGTIESYPRRDEVRTQAIDTVKETL